jgi:hypothetical protein
MIAEAIEKLQSLANDAKKTSILPVAEEPKGTYYLVGPDGKAELKVAAPGWHGEKLATPQQLADFVADRKRENSVVFYNETGIHFVYDRDDRRDGAYCNLLISPQYAYLSSPCAAMKQSDFIRLLRIQFRGCLGDSNLQADAVPPASSAGTAPFAFTPGIYSTLRAMTRSPLRRQSKQEIK